MPARRARDRFLEVVIDTPRGSRNKYKHDERRDVFVLHKLLPAGLPFPFDFGFAPGTRGDDGDALDVLVIHAEATFTGCRIPARVLGVLEAEQTEKDGRTIRNDRIVAVPETEKIRPTERSLDDLPPGLLDTIERFFAAYNRAEGRRFVVIGRGGPERAKRLLAAARRPKRRPRAASAKRAVTRRRAARARTSRRAQRRA